MRPPVSQSKVVKVIRTETSWGRGTQEDPARIVTQYFSLKGEPLAFVDPLERKVQ